MAEEAPAGWPNGFGQFAAGAPDAPSENPRARSRSGAASSHDRPATGAPLGHVSVRAERWLGGRQPGETLDQCGDIQQAKNQRMKPDQNRSRFRGDDEAGWLTARRQPESALVVCDHAQPEPGQANQLARRAEYAQLAHAKVRQNLCA